ncbi:hypothetical protein ACFL5F_00235 [Planctomycetota bacterium]
MLGKMTYFICFALLLGAVNSIQAEPFSLVPTFDGHVSNDADEGPDASPGGTGMHCRNQGGRRRVGFVTYDLSEAQSQGVNFSDVSFSNYGHDGGTVNVYGVLEAYEDLVTEGITWNTAPGVQNDPTPALDSDVALDLADVTEILLTFDAPARGTRESTVMSEALANFLSSDTNGFAAFMFAPEGSSGAIVRTVEMGEEGGTWLEGDIAGQRETAYKPDPVDGALHTDTWATLSWMPGAFAVSHNVYLGENFDDVNNGTGDTFRDNQTLTFYVAGFPGNAYPEGLIPGTTYYWRIDEVNEAEPNSPWKGDVWSFTVPPKTAYYPNPANGTELVDLNVQLSWTAGLDAKLHYIVFGEDYDEVNNAGAGIPNGNTNYDPGPLKLAKTYYWRVDEFDSIETHKGEIWSFTTAGAVSGPNPVDGAVDVSPTQILIWDAGAVAASHEVYFGTDAAAVKNATKSSPEYKGPKGLGEESYNPGKLALTTTYYWRIDEVNDVNPDSPWAGNIWSYTTSDFFVIDDFENYDAGENQIWYAWHDGLGYGTPGTADYFAGNGTGAAVGDETTASYTEETIVHGGSQSMPFVFDNNKQGYSKYSQVELTLSTVRDWTEEGVAELSLWFRGNPSSVGSFVEGPVGTYTMTAAGTDIWGVADEFHYAFKILTGPGSIIARVENVEQTDPWAKAGVMIRETLDAGSMFAAIYITSTNADGTATNGCRYQARMDTDIDATSDTAVATPEQTAITAPYWVKLDRDFAGNFRGYYSSDGVTWQSMSWNSQNIPMASNVYIGLAVTSHNAAATCEARFSNVTITGTVGPQWANQDIGILSNDPEPIYVAVSNSTGEPVVVVYDDPAATHIETWTEWVISLQDLADQGLNLNDVDRIAIGVGTRGNMTVPGGSGKMFFDDFRLYGPRDITVEE